jgi:hypothetical protein
MQQQHTEAFSTCHACESLFKPERPDRGANNVTDIRSVLPLCMQSAVLLLQLQLSHAASTTRIHKGYCRTLHRHAQAPYHSP